MMKRALSAVGVMLIATLPLCAAETIKSGHVLGNGTNAERTPQDVSLQAVAAQSGSGVSSSAAAAMANATCVNGGFITQPTPWVSGHGALIGASGCLVDSGSVPLSSALPITVSGATPGGVAYFPSAGSMGSSGLLTQYGVVVGGGSGNPPQTIAAGGAGTLLVGQGSANPQFLTPASSQTNVAAPTGTNSTTGLMMGIGATITPAATGRVLVTVAGSASNGNTSYSDTITLRTGTGTAPTNGAALTGTLRDTKVSGSNANGPWGFAFTFLLTGQALGTALWVDLGLATSNSGGSASLSNVSVSAIEF